MNDFKEKSLVNAINDKDTILAPYLARVDKLDGAFIAKKLAPFSNVIKSTILKEAFDKPNAFDRNA